MGMSGDEPSSDEDDQYTVLEAKLVDPTTNKREKLIETVSEYREALHDAFTQGCTTRSETNDVVTAYDLSGYAKNALKKYVPQLTGDSYDANTLAEDHPVRFTNEGPRFDHRPDNHHEWCMKLPHHEDYHLWCPLAINPEHEQWYHALVDEGRSVRLGETRLFERGGEWYVHVTIERETAIAPRCGSRDSCRRGRW